MKYRFLLTILLISIISINGFSQFRQSVGAGLVAGTGKTPAGADEGSTKPTIMGWGVFYNPRYNISETETGALSIGLPLTLGISGSVNSREGGSLSLLADLPITIDYNFGAGSTEDNASGLEVLSVRVLDIPIQAIPMSFTYLVL